MRFNSAVLLLSTLCGHLSLNALAAPIRIVVVEKVAISGSDAFLRSVRVGLAGAGTGANPPDITDGSGNSIQFDDLPELEAYSVVAVPMSPDAEFNILPFPNGLIDQQSEAMRKFCKEHKSWKTRFGRLSNWVREKLGLSIVRELSPCHLQLPAQSASIRLPLSPVALKHPPHNVTPTNAIASDARMPTSGPRFRRPGMWGRRRPKDFSGRLQRALYSLSPWEGRALAFVVGCGLGVLVRMLFVFIILSARALRCRSQSIELPEEEHEQVMEGVILFDAGSIKAASQDDLTLYNEK